MKAWVGIIAILISFMSCRSMCAGDHRDPLGNVQALKPVDRLARQAGRDVSEFWKVVGLVGGAMVFLAVFFPTRNYVCARCAQYLGSWPKACPRCGSNRYTTEE